MRSTRNEPSSFPGARTDPVVPSSTNMCLYTCTCTRETGEPGRTQDRSKDRRLRQDNCLLNLAWTKTVWRCRLRVYVPIGSQMPVFMTCENFCQAKKAGLVGPVCRAVLNGSSPLCLLWIYAWRQYAFEWEFRLYMYMCDLAFSLPHDRPCSTLYA